MSSRLPCVVKLGHSPVSFQIVCSSRGSFGRLVRGIQKTPLSEEIRHLSQGAPNHGEVIDLGSTREQQTDEFFVSLEGRPHQR